MGASVSMPTLILDKGDTVKWGYPAYKYYLFKLPNTSLSISEEISVINFELFPNPVTDLVKIKLENIQENNTIELIDVNGELVYTETSTGKEFVTINVQSFSKGVYVVKLRNE